MQLSIHYYVLSLTEQQSRLYEGFRDQLIDIQDTNFPYTFSIDAGTPLESDSRDTQLREFFHQTDQRFTSYYDQDPLRLVVVGEKRNLAISSSMETCQDVLIGTIEGNYSMTSPHDLGKIVWPVVKEAIAGVNENAMRDLETAAGLNKIVSGINAVGKFVETEKAHTLYVEEDYRVRGSICKTDHSLIISKHVDLREVIDDVVDVIIEKVLKIGGTVIFVKSGSLMQHERIALILRG